MNEKVKRFILLGAVVLLLGGVFFAGRTTGRGSLAEQIRNVENALDEAIKDRDAILDLSRGLIDDLGGLGSQFEGFETKLNEFNDSFQSGVRILDGTIQRNEEIYNEYLRASEKLKHAGGEFGNIIAEGDKFIESVESAVSGGPD